MSQVQSEVRPNVQQMPMSGFHLQTGGSARKRAIKPLFTQAATDQFPIQNEYRVSGVPGHTHNSSAVVSVLVDMVQTRGFDQNFSNTWADTAIEMKTADPGDSEVVLDEDDRFDRALERGIGEICLRPENCHHEIREPVRSISEVRTLVAPDDRLQTLTYVEEVGGFINKDKSTYISEFPDVFVDLLGYRDPDNAPTTAAGVLTYTNVAETTPIRLAVDKATATNIVVLRPTDNDASIGTLVGGADWYGIVRFRWDSTDMLYRSET